LQLLLLMFLFSCKDSPSEKCINYSIDWRNISKGTKVRFFRAEQFGNKRIDYLLHSCSDFTEMKEGWTDLSSEEVNQLKRIILDTTNWEQKSVPKSHKQDYLYAGFAVYSKEDCLIGKIDLIEAATLFLFYPDNKVVCQGNLNYKGSLAFDSLFYELERRAIE
jgi:hypothetical protein